MGNDDTNLAEKRNANKSSRGKSRNRHEGVPNWAVRNDIYSGVCPGRRVTRALTLLCCIALLCYTLEFEARFLALNSLKDHDTLGIPGREQLTSLLSLLEDAKTGAGDLHIANPIHALWRSDRPEAALQRPLEWKSSVGIAF